MAPDTTTRRVFVMCISLPCRTGCVRATRDYTTGTSHASAADVRVCSTRQRQSFQPRTVFHEFSEAAAPNLVRDTAAEAYHVIGKWCHDGHRPCTHLCDNREVSLELGSRNTALSRCDASGSLPLSPLGNLPALPGFMSSETQPVPTGGERCGGRFSRLAAVRPPGASPCLACGRAKVASRFSGLITFKQIRESPRLCRGDRRSLTLTGVHRGHFPT